MLTLEQLDSWLDKGMKDICLNGYSNEADNHCAHFVAHALNLNFGYTCHNHVGGTQPGANLRVHEIFARCPTTSQISQCGGGLTGIIFVSGQRNFSTSGGTATLANVPKKHVGLLLNDTVWHYSNTQNKVIKQPMSQFLFHYSKQTNALWIGSLPANTRPIYFGQC